MSNPKTTYIIPVSNGILEKKHRDQIGAAIWLFLWLIDKSTKDVAVEGGFEGLVLGGRPITTQYIAEQIGESARSVRYHLDELERYGYIRVTSNAGEANSYAVRKSKKFYRARAVIVGPELDEQEDADRGKNLQPEDELPLQEVAGGVAGNCQGGGKNFPRNKEDIPGIYQGDTRKPLRERKEKPTDPRRKVFIDDLKTFTEYVCGEGSFQPTGRDFRNLNLFLREHPKVTKEEFEKALRNRAKSIKADQFNAAEPIFKWIGSIMEFSAGPLDRYGKPLQLKGTNNGHKSRAQQAQDESIDAIRRAVSRVSGARAGDPEGGISGTERDDGDGLVVLEGIVDAGG